MTRAGEGSTSPKDPKGTGKDAGSNPAQSTGIKLITVSYDDSNGLEVDWEGLDIFAAYGYLIWAVAILEEEIAGEDVE